jgi:hypothetical protein
MTQTQSVYSWATIASILLLLITHYSGQPKAALFFLISTVILSIVGWSVWQYGAAFRELYTKITRSKKPN